MKNDTFPTYVGFLNPSCIVPAYAGDKEFVFFWHYYAPGTAAGESCILLYFVQHEQSYQSSAECTTFIVGWYMTQKSSARTLDSSRASWTVKNVDEIMVQVSH